MCVEGVGVWEGVRVCWCMCLYMCACTCVYECMHACVCMCVCVCECPCVSACVCMQVCVREAYLRLVEEPSLSSCTDVRMCAEILVLLFLLVFPLFAVKILLRRHLLHHLHHARLLLLSRVMAFFCLQW